MSQSRRRDMILDMIKVLPNSGFFFSAAGQFDYCSFSFNGFKIAVLILKV